MAGFEMAESASNRCRVVPPDFSSMGSLVLISTPGHKVWSQMEWAKESLARPFYGYVLVHPLSIQPDFYGYKDTRLATSRDQLMTISDRWPVLWLTKASSPWVCAGKKLHWVWVRGQSSPLSYPSLRLKTLLVK